LLKNHKNRNNNTLERDGVIFSGGKMRLSLATASNLKVASSRRGSETPFQEYCYSLLFFLATKVFESKISQVCCHNALRD